MGNKPSFIMLVGMPASGKSTFIKQVIEPFFGDKSFDFVVISSDNLIEEYAESVGKTYDEVFAEYASTANKMMMENARKAFRKNRDVIWDQTNLTVTSRAKKLRMVPRDYQKLAVYFQIHSLDVWKDRLAGRPGKTIPENVIESMSKSLVTPTEKEGFDNVKWI